ncbi:MAG: hypothetical protein V4439_02390 [Patescibacteria group bacterium]
MKNIALDKFMYLYRLINEFPAYILYYAGAQKELAENPLKSKHVH